MRLLVALFLAILGSVSTAFAGMFGGSGLGDIDGIIRQVMVAGERVEGTDVDALKFPSVPAVPNNIIASSSSAGGSPCKVASTTVYVCSPGAPPKPIIVIQGVVPTTNVQPVSSLPAPSAGAVVVFNRQQVTIAFQLKDADGQDIVSLGPGEKYARKCKVDTTASIKTGGITTQTDLPAGGVYEIVPVGALYYFRRVG